MILSIPPPFLTLRTSSVSWRSRCDHAAKATHIRIHEKVKGSRRTSRISTKRQITIPVETLRAAGLEIGERVRVTSAGVGRVILKRDRDVLADFVGALTGVYARDHLEKFRAEWR